MNTIMKLTDWLMRFRVKHGCEPSVMPVTLNEINAVCREAGPSYLVCGSQNKVMGFEPWTTDLAEPIRVRQLEVPMTYVMTEYPVDDCLSANLQLEQARYGFKQMRAMVMREQTQVTVKFEWDCWAWLKRLFRRPVRQRTAVIDCTVFYPYCRVSLPHNRHTFQCQVHQQ